MLNLRRNILHRRWYSTLLICLLSNGIACRLAGVLFDDIDIIATITDWHRYYSVPAGDLRFLMVTRELHVKSYCPAHFVARTFCPPRRTASCRHLHGGVNVSSVAHTRCWFHAPEQHALSTFQHDYEAAAVAVLPTAVTSGPSCRRQVMVFANFARSTAVMAVC